MSQRKLILSMQITLDGYVAGPNDEADWLIVSDDEWTDLNQDLDTAGYLFIGKKNVSRIFQILAIRFK